MDVTSAPNIAVRSKPAPPKEVGGEKTVSQHIGNAGFGASSVAAFTESLGTITDSVVSFPGMDAVPGLNLVVAGVESYNSIKKLREKDPIVAATHGGNAMGALGTFMAQLSLVPAVFRKLGNSGMLLGLGAAFGAIGGGLGIAAGVAEIKQGREVMKAGGSSRTFAMGCLDITSGVVSLSGAAAMALGAAPVGIALMMTANMVDLAGIGVDYLWKKAGQKDAAEDGAGAPSSPEQTPAGSACAPEAAPLAAAETSGDPAGPTEVQPVLIAAAQGSSGSAPSTLVQMPLA